MGWSSPYADRNAAISSARRLPPPNRISTGSPGASRSTQNEISVIPKNVGIAWITRLRTNLPISYPSVPARNQLLNPPRFGLGLALARERAGGDVLDLLVHPEQHVLRKAKVVRLLLVEDLVRGLDRRLAIRLRAMRTAVLDHLVEVRILVLDVVVLTGMRGVGVPDRIHVRLRRQGPADHVGIEIMPAVVPVFGILRRVDPVDERLERLRLRLHADADLAVLLRRHLDERLADHVARVGDDRKLQLLAVLGVNPIRALHVARLLQQLL